MGIARRALQHSINAHRRRRHDRQAIRPVALEGRLVLVFVAADLDGAGFESEVAEFQRQLVGDIGVGRQGAAAGALNRKFRPQAFHLGDRLPLRAMPADGTVDLLAAFEPQHRGHRLDLVVPGQFQLAVIDHGARAARKHRVVLRDDRDLPRSGQLPQDRLDHDAGRAIAFDDYGEAVRQLLHGLAPSF